MSRCYLHQAAVLVLINIFGVSNYAGVVSSSSTGAVKLNPTTNLLLQPKLMFTSYKYNEPGVMTIAGAMTGVDLSARAKDNLSQLFFGGGLEYLTGTPTYDGSLMNEERTPISHKSDHYFYTLYGEVGTAVAAPSGASMEFSAGLAHRYLNDKGQSKYAYEREQTYNYIPLTAKLINPIDHNLVLSGGLELDVFLSGENKSHLEDVAPGAPTLKFKQSKGSGSKIFLAASNKIDNMHFVAEIFRRSWNIADSDLYPVSGENDNGEIETGYFLEPKNKTDITGVSIGAVF